MKIVLGVCGGIAAYKSCEIARLLSKESYDVQVVMTQSAQQFVTPLTFQTLTQNLVATDLFDLTQESEIGHIHLADSADLILIAPTTANFLAKASLGLCDDLLSTLLLATKAPVVMAPSMNVNMWDHPLTQANIQKLKSIGYHFIEPAEGYLACGWEGKGRLAEPQDIVAFIKNICHKNG